MLTRTLLLIVFIGIYALFAASEIALISMNDNKINQLAQM